MPTKKPPVKPEVEFPIVTAETLWNHIQLSRPQLAALRKILDKDIYWFQPIHRGNVLYNLILVKNFIQCGKGRDHDRLIEQYIQSLPKPK